MSSSGPNSPGTGSTAARAGNAGLWTNPSNVTASDNSYVTGSGLSGSGPSYTNYLTATNFGFAVSGTIDGIVVEIERKAIGGIPYHLKDSILSLIKGGTISGDNKASGTDWDATETYYSYGSSSDLWGLTLADTDVNASNFGVALSIGAGATGKDSAAGVVDHIRMTVYYTAGGAAGQPTSKRFGGVPFMGAHGSGLQAPVRQWIRRAAGLLTPQFATTQIWRPAHGID